MISVSVSFVRVGIHVCFDNENTHSTFNLAENQQNRLISDTHIV